MGKLFVMRHSVTYYNENDRFAGNQDIPLSKNGIMDALQMGAKFTYENFDLVFTSSLSRSYDTAVLFLSQLHLDKVPIRISKEKLRTFTRKDLLPIVQFEELDERNYGILQDMDKHTIANSIPAETLKSWRRDYYEGPIDGETFQQVVSRVAKFYYSILLPALKSKDVLVVAHQNTMRALYYLVYNINKDDMDDIEFQNTDMWTVNFDSITSSKTYVPKNIVVLANSIGSKMPALTENTPKALIDINGKPLISYPIDYLRTHGFNISVVYSHLKEKWNGFIACNKDIEFIYSPPEQTYHDNLISYFQNMDSDSNYVFVLSGDMIFNYSIFEIAMQEHIIKENSISVVLNKRYGRKKRWRYILNPNGSTIDNIVIEESIQPYERYFIIANIETIQRYCNIILQRNDIIKKNSCFGSGACFFVKNLIDLGMPVNYILFEDYIVNVSSEQDVIEAKKLLDENKV